MTPASSLTEILQFLRLENLELIELEMVGGKLPGCRVHLHVARTDCAEVECISAADRPALARHGRPVDIIRGNLDGVGRRKAVSTLDQRHLTERLTAA